MQIRLGSLAPSRDDGALVAAFPGFDRVSRCGLATQVNFDPLLLAGHRHPANGVILVAQKVQTLYIDDIDGSEAAGTVRFGLDGVDYEIDLSAGHTDEFHAALRRYIDHGRKVGDTSKRSPRGRRTGSAIDTTAVRTWAREQGIDIKDRGRVPADIVAKYEAATGR